LGLVAPKPGALFVIQHAEFGYTVNLPLAVMDADNFLLATLYEGSRSAWITARLCVGSAVQSQGGMT